MLKSSQNIKPRSTNSTHAPHKFWNHTLKLLSFSYPHSQFQSSTNRPTAAAAEIQSSNPLIPLKIQNNKWQKTTLPNSYKQIHHIHTFKTSNTTSYIHKEKHKKSRERILHYFLSMLHKRAWLPLKWRRRSSAATTPSYNNSLQTQNMQVLLISPTRVQLPQTTPPLKGSSIQRLKGQNPRLPRFGCRAW